MQSRRRRVKYPKENGGQECEITDNWEQKACFEPKCEKHIVVTTPTTTAKPGYVIIWYRLNGIHLRSSICDYLMTGIMGNILC